VPLLSIVTPPILNDSSNVEKTVKNGTSKD
jgi:hypothetical protein